jgi:hypothetical protein
MCAPRRAAAVVRPRGREKSADRRRRILISRLLIIRASVPRRKSPFPAYFKGFPAVSLLIPPYPAFLKYPVSPQEESYTVRCSIIQPGQQSLFDNEHTVYETVKVGEADATLGTSASENGDTVYILSWEQGGVSNTIMGNISRDEIMKIAENVF